MILLSSIKHWTMRSIPIRRWNKDYTLEMILWVFDKVAKSWIFFIIRCRCFITKYFYFILNESESKERDVFWSTNVSQKQWLGIITGIPRQRQLAERCHVSGDRHFKWGQAIMTQWCLLTNCSKIRCKLYDCVIFT